MKFIVDSTVKRRPLKELHTIFDKMYAIEDNLEDIFVHKITELGEIAVNRIDSKVASIGVYIGKDNYCTYIISLKDCASEGFCLLVHTKYEVESFELLDKIACKEDNEEEDDSYDFLEDITEYRVGIKNSYYHELGDSEYYFTFTD